MYTQKMYSLMTRDTNKIEKINIQITQNEIWKNVENWMMLHFDNTDKYDRRQHFENNYKRLWEILKD